MQMLYESKLILVKFEECLEANCEVVERATEKKSKYSKKKWQVKIPKLEIRQWEVIITYH